MSLSVSILICTYGDPEWQRLAETRARPSALAQALPATEVVCHHEDNGTLASARNFAAAAAVGDWLCFLDADDTLAPGYLAAMLDKMHHWNLWRPHDLLENPLLLVPAIQYDQETEPCIPAWGRELYEINCAVIGTLVPQALFLRAGGFRELKALEDWELWMRLHYHHGARLIDVCEAVYRAHSVIGGRNRDQSLYWRLRREYEYKAAGG